MLVFFLIQVILRCLLNYNLGKIKILVIIGTVDNELSQQKYIVKVIILKFTHLNMDYYFNLTSKAEL